MQTPGYTKAVDLWSLGCVTAVLLTGGSPFTDPATEEYSQALANKCDLAKLEMNHDWRSSSHRAKDFVRHLLVRDEALRFDVEQALAHHWFTNIYQKSAFQEVYKRSIQDWRPVVRKGQVGTRHELSQLRKIKQAHKAALRPAEHPYKPYERSMAAKIYRSRGRSGFDSSAQVKHIPGRSSRNVETSSCLASRKTCLLSPTLTDPEL